MADAHSHALLHPSTSSTASYPGLLYKILAFVVFLIVMPFFPSQAPQFLNKILLTGSWELLHLLVVGIAVSYGLFSSRNRNSEKDIRSRADVSSQYDFSRCFQAPPVFDNIAEISIGPEESSESRIWRTPSYVDDQPLFLPLRSLKCCDSDTDLGKSLDPAPFCIGSRGGDSCDFVNLDAEEGFEDVISTRSLLSWRSISGGFKDDDTECLQQCIPQSEVASATHFPNNLVFSSAGRSPRPSPHFPHLQCNNSEEFQEKNHARSPPMLRTWNADGGKIGSQINKSKMESKSVDGDRFGSNRGTEMAERVQVIEPPPRPAMEDEKAAREGNFHNSHQFSEVIVESEEKGEKKEHEENENESDDGRDCGRDVDKKADEFIAKFRERIRLQRIDSIKRSSRDHKN